MTGGTVGVDIGGTKLLAVRVDDEGRVLEERVAPSPRNGSRLVSEVLDAAHSLGGTPSSVGVGVPGVVDGSGELVFAPNLQGAVGVRLSAELEKALPGAGIWVGNDANAACWGEYRAGAGAGRDGMVLVALGTGIGGGIVTDGRLYEGSNRFAGEFGHVVVDPDGPLCPCGKRGCWERYASGAGLGMFGREAAMAGAARRVTELAGGDPESVKGEHVTAAVAEGDAEAEVVMTRFAWWVALGLANLVAGLDPPVIVIGGGLVEAGEILMAPVREALAGLIAGSAVRPELPLLAASLGSRAGAVGAALLGRR